MKFIIMFIIASSLFIGCSSKYSLNLTLNTSNNNESELLKPTPTPNKVIIDWENLVNQSKTIFIGKVTKKTFWLIDQNRNKTNHMMQNPSEYVLGRLIEIQVTKNFITDKKLSSEPLKYIYLQGIFSSTDEIQPTLLKDESYIFCVLPFESEKNVNPIVMNPANSGIDPKFNFELVLKGFSDRQSIYLEKDLTQKDFDKLEELSKLKKTVEKE
jgi:hypothetical protein